MVNRVLATTTALTAAGALLFTPVAGAKAGDKSFAQTYPIASALCARVAAGQTPRKLKASQAQVTQACTTLRNAFGPLQTAVQSANSQFQTGVANQRAAIRAACQSAPRTPSCRNARRNGRLAIASLRRQHRAAVRQYFISIEANRRTFWATIRSLRGGSSIKPDKPIAPESS